MTDADPPTIRLPPGEAPESIGPYRILEAIGHGGFGTVYLAQQERPVRRRVALKIIKPGMGSRDVIARFEAERQALAMMDHPGVAMVLDAGISEDERPYFAMEYVPGVPITQYCDQNRLTTRERLRLFVQVCAAIQHAHQKGLIHRDIKPSNVLVTVKGDQPQAKVIDFGIAKATQHRLSEKTIYTQRGELIGTPEYMSPEQADTSGLDVDTRTDIYSLGVLLYEILTGTLPFERSTLKAGFAQMLHAVTEQEPPRPSARMSTGGVECREAARKRRTDPESLQRLLKGDLDWITMKALEKDRSRRYSSASELAADIDRHLEGLPVLAGPPSLAYRARKLIGRHRLAFVAFAALLVSLILGIAGTTWMAVVAAHREKEARQAEALAKREAEAAQQVSDFLVGLFEVSHPGEARGNTVTAREILDRGAERIQRELGDQPLVQARLMATMGEVYQMLGLYAEARPLLHRALEIRRVQLGEVHPDVATSLGSLGWFLFQRGNYEESRQHFERALAMREEVFGLEHAAVGEAMNNLALPLMVMGKHQEAKELFERALEVRERALGPDHPDVAETLNNLGVLLWQMGEHRAARPLYERALEIREKTLGSDHPDLAQTLTGIGVLVMQLGDYEQARPLLERALALRERALGPEHPEVAAAANNLAGLLERIGETEAARSLLERCRKIYEKAFGPDHPRFVHSLTRLGALAIDVGDHATARSYLEKALALHEKRKQMDHRFAGWTLVHLGRLRLETGKTAEAKPMLERAIGVFEQIFGSDHINLATPLRHLANALRASGNLEGAEPLYERAIRIIESRLGSQHPDLVEILEDYAVLLRQQGRSTEAAETARRAEAIRKSRNKDIGGNHRT